MSAEAWAVIGVGALGVFSSWIGVAIALGSFREKIATLRSDLNETKTEVGEHTRQIYRLKERVSVIEGACDMQRGDS